EHVEAHHIPRLELPAEDAEGGAVGLDVRKIGETALGKPARLGIAKRAGHEPGPEVGAGDELQCRLAAHRINRNPEAAVLAAADVVIRLVLVPRCALPRARRLGQHVIVIQPGAAAAHERCPCSAECRFEYDLTVTVVLLPAAEILDEPPR